MIIGALGFLAFWMEQEGIDIKIENDTKKEVSGLYLTYNNIKSDIKIPSIASGEKHTLNINTSEDSNNDFSEATLKLELKIKKEFYIQNMLLDTSKKVIQEKQS